MSKEDSTIQVPSERVVNSNIIVKIVFEQRVTFNSYYQNPESKLRLINSGINADER
jgi:hypothetical protein